MKCKTCKSDTVETIDLGYPAAYCESCDRVENKWKVFVEDYMLRWQDDAMWDKSSEKGACIIGYFCDKYKKAYGVDFSFSMTTADPFRTNDWIQCRRLLVYFGGDALSVKKYIDWYFENEIPKKKRRITSLGGLNTQWVINNFKQYLQLNKRIRRTSSLPSEFLNWCKENAPSIFDKQKLTSYEDLNFLISYCGTYDMCFDDVELKVANEAVKRNIAPAKGLVKFEE